SRQWALGRGWRIRDPAPARYRPPRTRPQDRSQPARRRVDAAMHGVGRWLAAALLGCAPATAGPLLQKRHRGVRRPTGWGVWAWHHADPLGLLSPPVPGGVADRGGRLAGPVAAAFCGPRRERVN